LGVKVNLIPLTVNIEVTEEVFSDKISDLIALEKKIGKALHTVLNIAGKVELVEPGSIPRSVGKAQRVIDNRKLK
jgi:phenylacetate-CoA ligase